MNVKVRSQMAYLFSATIVVVLTVVFLTAGRMFAIHLEERTLRATAP
jgi:hypothetical protein